MMFNANPHKYLETTAELSTHLLVNRVPFTVAPLYDGFQFTFPWCKGDVVCHHGSYGANYGHVESMDFPWDESDVTEDTVEQMAVNIVVYYRKLKGE